MKGKKIVIILIIPIILLAYLIISQKGENKNENKTNNKANNITLNDAANLGIDINDEAYAGKNIYVENGDIIIENEDGGKTIESTKKEETDLNEVSQENKNKYEITNVNVQISGNRTAVTGKIKNNTGSNHKVSIGVKFYSAEKRVKGSSSTIIENLKSNETQDFEIVLMGNMTGYTYNVEVEYTN